MPERSEYATGELCWADLTTTDVGATTTFYRTIFGWEGEPVPGGGGYAMFSIGGRNVCAVSPKIDADPRPPSWAVYASVDDVDKTLELATGAGGTVLVPAFEVMTAGRMAAIADPAGAALFLWEANEHPGAAVIDEPGALTWFELTTADTAAAEAFYREVMGWGAETSDGGGLPYTEFTLGGKSVAGMMPKAPELGDAPSSWMPYFQATDPDKVAREVTALGGTLLAGPDDVPGSGGRYAVVADPQGAAFGLYRPA